MTDAGNRILGSQMAMRQNGVAGAVLVGTKHILLRAIMTLWWMEVPLSACKM